MAKKRPETLRAPVPPAARTLQARANALQRFHPEMVSEIAELRRRAVFVELQAQIKRVGHRLTVEERSQLVGTLGVD